MYNLTKNFRDIFENPTFKKVFNEERFPMKVTGDNEKINVIAYLPGIDKENIDILYKNDYVTIKVNKKEEEKKEEKQVYYSDLYEVNTERVIYAPKIDPENIKAVLKDGVLNVELPIKDNSRKIIIS